MRLKFNVFNLSAAVLSGMMLATGCTTDEGIKPQDDSQLETRGLISGGAANSALIGLSANNELVNLLSGPPAQEQSVIPITGLRSEEVMLAIDTRLKTKQLYGVSDQSIIYIIDKFSGVATPLLNGPFTPLISGNLVAFDINPADDLIRLVTDTGQSLRISPASGAVVGVDNFVNILQTAINSVAYLPFISGGKSVLYDIDLASGNLYKQLTATSPLQLVGSTGFDWRTEGGFDITAAGLGFAVQTGHIRAGGGGFGSDDLTQDACRLYSINLKTGKATSLGKVRPMIGLTQK